MDRESRPCLIKSMAGNSLALYSGIKDAGPYWIQRGHIGTVLVEFGNRTVHADKSGTRAQWEAYVLAVTTFNIATLIFEDPTKEQVRLVASAVRIAWDNWFTVGSNKLGMLETYVTGKVMDKIEVEA